MSNAEDFIEKHIKTCSNNMRSRVYFILGMLCTSIGVAAISWKLGLIWAGVISFIQSYLEFEEESKE